MESSKLLSGRDLVENVSVKVSDTVLAKGAKQVLPNGSWIENRQIESALDTFKSLLEQQRIEKHGSLSQAEWIHKIEKALVTEKKGPHWLHIGHVENQKTYIYPEEALHLLEMNSLELKYGGVIMSLQQAYCLLIGKSVSPDEYRVYSLLSKQGFKLIRYNKDRQYYSTENTNDSNENLETSLIKENLEIIKHPKVDDTDKTNSVKLDSKEKSDEALSNKFLENKDNDDLVTIDKKASTTIEKSVNRVEIMSTFETVSVSGIATNDSFQDLLEKEMSCIHGLNNSISTDANVNDIMSSESCKGIDDTLAGSKRETKPNSLNCNIVSEKDNVNNVNEIEKSEEVKNNGDVNCKDSAAVTEDLIDIDSSEMSVAPLNNDSVDIIDVDRSDTLLEDSNNIKSNSNHLQSDSVPGETDVINTTDNLAETNSMCVDSSSDDCMIVNECSKKTEIAVSIDKFGPKRTSAQENMSNSCSKFFRKNTCNENSIERTAVNNSNDIDTIEFSRRVKIKFFDSMVNCHRKSVVIFKAPKREFIPTKINLRQSLYSVDLYKFQSKRDFVNVNRPCSFTNRVHSNQFPNNTSTNLPNNSSHNHQYWNHIFHHVRMQSRNSNAERRNYPDGFGGQINIFNSRDPRKNPNPSPFLHHQFSINQREIDHTFDCRDAPSQSSGEMTRINGPSLIFFNDNIRNHVNKANMLKQNQATRRNIENRLNAAGARSNDDDESLSQGVALKRIETLLSTYNSLNDQQRSQLKDSLKKTIDLYNKQYKTNFIPDLDMSELNNTLNTSFSNSSKNTFDAPNKGVVQLSSDSDTDNRSHNTSRGDSNPRRDVKRVKKRTRLELNQRRQRYSSLCFDVNNSDSSNESDFDNTTVLPQSIINPRQTDYDSDQILTNNKTRNNIPPKVMTDNPGDVQSKENPIRPDESVFKSWISANCWNKPEVSSKMPKNKRIAFTNLNLSSAYLRNIRELSFNEITPVHSWQQAKQVYENENMSKIVCVSDDEMLNAEKTTDVSANESTILIDKTAPLVGRDDCKTVESVLKKLRIIKSTGEISDFDETRVLTELKISFDVYAPTLKKLKKTCLPLPNYSIVVLSHSSPLPTPEEFLKLRSNLAVNVPYLLAVVSFDAVSFIQMENVDLPILIRRNYSMKF